MQKKMYSILKISWLLSIFLLLVTSTSAQISSCPSGGSPGYIFAETWETGQAGWTGYIGSANGQWHINSGHTPSLNTGPDGAHSGNYYIFYEASGAGSPGMASMVSPAIDLSTGSHSAYLSFWMHAYGMDIPNATLSVSVSNSPNGPFSTIHSQTFQSQLQNNHSDPYIQQFVDLSSYVGQVIYLEIAYHNPNSWASDLALDLIQVETCLSCPPPTNFTLATTTSTTALLDWTDPAAGNTWEVEYGMPDFTPGSGIRVSVSSKPTLITGLSPLTQYDFYLRSLCGSDTSVWTGPLSGSTKFECLPGAYCFNNVGSTGNTGPTQAQINAAYTGTTLSGSVTSINGIQRWVVPQTGVYRITAAGAKGGDGPSAVTGGKGAVLNGEFLLQQNDTLFLLVGQQGVSSASAAGGGGGGTFVTKAHPLGNQTTWGPKVSPLIIAGGGGGAGGDNIPDAYGVGGASPEDAVNIYGLAMGEGTPDAQGYKEYDGNEGTPGYGGVTGASSNAGGGGGGYLSSGSTSGGNGLPGQGFLQGGEGSPGAGSDQGGFGGGASTPLTNSYCSAGGGGGYSGGAGGNRYYTPTDRIGGGGGGSFNAGVNQSNQSGHHDGHGLVMIAPVSSGFPEDAGVVSIDEPTIFCPGSQDVHVTIANYGTNPLDSVEVHWSVNGVNQTDVHYTGPSLGAVGGTGATTTQVNLGSYTFTNAVYEIKAWTENPNGVNDPNKTNDTTTTTVQSHIPPPTGLALVNVSGNTVEFTWSPFDPANNWLHVIVPQGNAPETGTYKLSTSDTALATGLVPTTDYDIYVAELCPGATDTSGWAGPLNFQTVSGCLGDAFCFTNAGATGANGPTQSQLNTTYAGSTLDGNVTSLNGIQQWIVPSTGTYRITTIGAEGGYNSGNNAPAGLGAMMEADFSLNTGDTLHIIVGQAGTGVQSGGGTGGGGSFVVKSDQTPLIIAAGGSGAPNSTNYGQLNGKTSHRGPYGGLGHQTSNNGAGGGGGFLTDGQSANPPMDGKAYVNGGEGGTGSGGEGGFGGGGGKGGAFNDGAGGGGYSGGDHNYSATQYGGGGSFNSGMNPAIQEGVGAGHGLVMINPIIATTGDQNDAGVTSINEPNVFCPGSHDVVVSIQNFGSNKINSVDVHWSVNGMPQTPATYTGTLDTTGGIGSSSASVNLGSYNFSTATHNVKAWTTNPNGQTDPVNANDTANATISWNIPSPKNLSVSSVTASSATFSWTPYSISNTWTYVVVPQGDPATSGTPVQATSTSATATGLSMMTEYDIYVAEVCPGGTAITAWAGPVSFTTEFECPPQAFCFTNAGATGHEGPSQAQVTSEYSGTNLSGKVTVVSPGIQMFNIPATGDYNITAYGAGFGETPEQRGARMSGEFSLSANTTLKVLVGQMGQNARCGSGGSFVTELNDNPLIIAGGAGGQIEGAPGHPNTSGATSTSGQNGVLANAAGGTNGSAGSIGGAAWAQPGAGLTGDAVGTDATQAQAFINGGRGATTQDNQSGGFGGGGTGRLITNYRIGGGGGYSGGASDGTATGSYGGGGGSFNAGTSQDNANGIREGHGLVVIQSLTPLTVSASASSTSVCQGDQITLTAQAGGGMGPYSYTWTSQPAGFSGSQENVTATVTSTTKYIISVTDGFTTAVDSITITANPVPTANFSGLGPQYCEDETPATLSGSPSGGTFSGTGITGNTFDPAAAGPGTHSITYTYTNTHGCTDDITKTTQVHSLPTVSFSGLSSSYCEGDPVVTLTETPAGGTFSGNGMWANSFDPVAAGTGTHTITYSYTDTNGCSSADSQTTTIHPVHSITASATPNPVSYSNTATLNVSVSGTSTYSYLWSPADSLDSPANATQQNPATKVMLAPTTFTVIVADDVTGCDNTDNVFINVTGGPLAASPVATPATVCRGDSVDLAAQASGGTETYTYSWTSNPTGFNSTQANPKAVVNQPTTFTVVVDDGNNTVSSSVFVDTWPVISPNFSGLDPVFCEGDAIAILSGSPSGGIFSGPGVSTNTFDPVAAGVGVHAITYTYTDTHGCTYDTAKTTEVVALPAVSMSGLQASYCANDPAQPLTGTPTAGTFSGPGISGNSFYPANAGPGTYTITYSYTDTHGCSSQDAANTTVVDLPVVTATATPNPVTFNTSSTLNATVTGTSTYSYLWSPADSLDNPVNATQQNPSTKGLTVPTTFNVTVTDNATSCYNTDNVFLSIIGGALTSSPSASKDTVCSGDSTKLFANASGGSGTYTYSWSSQPPGFSSTQASPMAQVNVPTTFTVTIDDGTQSITESVHVATYADVQPDFTGLGLTYCENDLPSTLSGTPSGGSFSGNGITGNTFYPDVAGVGTHQITYSFSDVHGCTYEETKTTEVLTLPNITFSGLQPSYCENDPAQTLTGIPPGGTFTGAGVVGNSFYPANAGVGTHYINYHFTGANGCSNVDSMSTSVSEIPVVNATAMPNPVTYGTATTLNSGISDTANYSFLWSPADSLSNPANATMPNPVTKTLTKPTTFTVTVTDNNNGCGNTGQVFVSIIGGPLSVNPAASQSMVCSGDSVDLFAQASGGSGSYTYSWASIPSGFNSTLADPKAQILENTTFIVTADDGTDSHTDSVTVFASKPIANLGPDTTLLAGQPLTLSVDPGYKQYLWSTGDTINSITIDTISHGMGQSNIWVMVTDTIGCTASDTIAVTFTTNINLANLSENIQIFPNPTKGEFTMKISGNTDKKIQVCIYNFQGQKILCENISRSDDGYHNTFDLSMQPKGVYLIRITGNKTISTKKIIIQ